MNSLTRSPLRALIVTPGLTFMPGDVAVQTPDGALSKGLPSLLGRIQARFSREGVLLLDGRAAVALGLPVDGQALADGIEDHPALGAARAAGWQVSKLRPWTTFHGEGRTTVHLGILPAIDPARSPIICPTPHDTLTALTGWHTLIGTAYHGTPGVAGISALRELADGGSKGCTWQPDGGTPDGAAEDDFKVDHWRGRLPRGHRWRHSFDAYRMYLGAAGVVPLTPWRLKPTGRVRYAPGLSGWWLVTIAPWQGQDSGILLPDPAGYIAGVEPGQPRPVTGPTLALLDELAAEGIHGGYEVHDSFTGKVIEASGGRPLRPWADRWRDAGMAVPEPGERANGALPLYDAAGSGAPDAIAQALKAGYRETWGLLNSPNSRVRRPDWHFAWLAQARSNLWRKMYRVGRTEKRWPLFIDVDNVWYSSDSEDPMSAAPKGWQIIGHGADRGLGKWKCKGSKPVSGKGQ